MKKILIAFLFLFGSICSRAQEQFSLEQAIAYALTNHNEMKMNDLDYQSAEQTIKEFRAIGMPKVNGGVDYSYYFKTPKQPVVDFITPSVYGVLFNEDVIPVKDIGPLETFEFSFVQPNALSANIGANMLLFDGSYLYGLKAAKLYKDLVRKERNQTEQSIIAKVSKAYMAILIVEKNKEVITKDIEIVAKALSDITEVYNNGFAESLDVDRLQLSLETLKTTSNNIDQQIQLSYNLLKFQMNYPIDKSISITDDLEIMVDLVTVDEINLEESIDMSRRAEFGVLEVGQQLNELDFKRVKAGYLPTASAFLNLQESLQRTNLFDNDEAGWLPTVVAGISIKAPIYDGGEKSAQMQNIRLTIDKTNLQKQELERVITLQVRNAQRSIINARNSVASRKSNLELSRKIYDKSRIKFVEGVGSSVELSQAETELYRAQANYINSLYDLLIAKTDLNLALAKN